MSDPSVVLMGYLIIANIAAFAIFGADKYKAQRHRWRVPEKTLFLIALLGGSPGAILGMRIFHHKTRHWYFVVGMPLILTVQVLAGLLFMYLCKKGT